MIRAAADLSSMWHALQHRWEIAFEMAGSDPSLIMSIIGSDKWWRRCPCTDTLMWDENTYLNVIPSPHTQHLNGQSAHFLPVTPIATTRPLGVLIHATPA
jgi:hypothetical protein